MPPPVRRITVDRDPYVAPPRPVSNGSSPAARYLRIVLRSRPV